MSLGVEVKIETENDIAKMEADVSSLKIADDAKLDGQKPKQQKDNNKKKRDKKPGKSGEQVDNKAAEKQNAQKKKDGESGEKVDKKPAEKQKAEEKKPVVKSSEKKVAAKPVEKRIAVATAADQPDFADDSKAEVKLEEKHVPVNALPEKRAPFIVRGVSGKVSWYSFVKGFGFIQRDDGEPDVFVHSSAIVRMGRNTRILTENEKVEFDVINGHKGPEAAAVTGKGGKPVPGYTYMVANQLRISRGLRSRSFRRNRYHEGRRGQNSDDDDEEDSNVDSGDVRSSDGDSSSSGSGASSQSVDEKCDDVDQPKGTDAKSK